MINSSDRSRDLTSSKKTVFGKKEAVLYEVRFWTLLPNGTIS